MCMLPFVNHACERIFCGKISQNLVGKWPVNRSMKYDSVLNSVCTKYVLKNIDLIWNLYDYIVIILNHTFV